MKRTGDAGAACLCPYLGVVVLPLLSPLCLWNPRGKDVSGFDGNVVRLLDFSALSATLMNECMWQQRLVNQSFDDEAMKLLNMLFLFQDAAPGWTRLPDSLGSDASRLA